MITIFNVAQYIYDRKFNTYMQEWSIGEVVVEVTDLVAHQEIRIVDNGREIQGVIIFDYYRDIFRVRQFWAESKETVQKFLAQLAKEYPRVTTIEGNRQGRGNKQFNVATLRKIFYGRRQTSTSTTRVNADNARELSQSIS